MVESSGGLKKRAKEILKGCRAGDGIAVDFIRRYHAAYKNDESLGSLKLQEVQYALACKAGYKNWSEYLIAVHDGNMKHASSERVLIFTNGGHAAERLQESGVKGKIVAWNDVLHEGPVSKAFSLLAQSIERVEHLSSLGWTTVEAGKNAFRERDRFVSDAASFDRVELWFEHDLYDQLQLIQIVSELGRNPRIRGKVWLNQFDDYIGTVRKSVLKSATGNSIQLSDEAFLDARMAWDSFRDPSPWALQDLLKRDICLPKLMPALLRLVEEYPDTDSGLPRSYRQALEEISNGATKPMDLFKLCQEREEAIYLGDSSFWILLQRMSSGRVPLIRTQSGRQFQPMKMDGSNGRKFKLQRFELTEAGAHVLSGAKDWADLGPEPFWLGGVELFGKIDWRFDCSKQLLCRR